jgi:LPS sulfotransferase NodH
MGQMIHDLPIRFVIIAQQRTGSNMLVSALDSHPGVRCLGELFRMGKKPDRGVGLAISMLDEIYQDESYQVDHWRDYLDAVVETAGPVAAVGFKIMLNQNRNVMQSLVEDPGYRKIFLNRENVLAVYSSHKIAKETGQGAAGLAMQVKKARVAFDPEEFEKFSARYLRHYHEAEQVLNDSGQDFYKTTYSYITTPQGIDAVLGYIGVDCKQGWNVGTQKRNSPVLTERFNNPQVVRDYMSGMGRLDWLQE